MNFCFALVPERAVLTFVLIESGADMTVFTASASNRHNLLGIQ